MEIQSAGKKNIWKQAFFVQLAFFLCLTGFLIYKAIDFGISFTYMQDEYSDTVDDLKVMTKLLPKVSSDLSKKDFVYLLRKTNRDTVIDDTGNTICIESLEFRFDKNDKLIEVSSQMNGK